MMIELNLCEGVLTWPQKVVKCGILRKELYINMSDAITNLARIPKSNTMDRRGIDRKNQVRLKVSLLVTAASV